MVGRDLKAHRKGLKLGTVPAKCRGQTPPIAMQFSLFMTFMMTFMGTFMGTVPRRSYFCGWVLRLESAPYQMAHLNFGTGFAYNFTSPMVGGES